MDAYGPAVSGGAAPAKAADDDDDFDLFGSDEEDDAEAERIKEERLAAYAEKKSKSMFQGMVYVLNITDFKELDLCFQKLVSGELHTLYWGGFPDRVSNLVPLIHTFSLVIIVLALY